VEHREKSERREAQKAKEGGQLILSLGNIDLDLGLEKISYLYLLFFSSIGLVESVQFGSVQSILDFENRTGIFYDFLIFSILLV
jgi:hypothetical protein